MLTYHFTNIKLKSNDKNVALWKEAGPPPVPTLASSTQGTTFVNNRFRASHSVYNSWQHRRWDDSRAWFTTAVICRQVKQEVVLISAHILYLKPKSPQEASGERSERGNRITDANFLTVFHGNYGSILLSFRDMTTGWTLDDELTMATIAYLAPGKPTIICMCQTFIWSSGRMMIRTVWRRAIFSNDCNVIFVFNFSIKRRHRANYSSLAINVELPVVVTNLLDAVCYLECKQLWQLNQPPRFSLAY